MRSSSEQEEKSVTQFKKRTDINRNSTDILCLHLSLRQGLRLSPQFRVLTQYAMHKGQLKWSKWENDSPPKQISHLEPDVSFPINPA
jgi:hypothetical protein